MRTIREVPVLHKVLFGALALAGLTSNQAMSAEAATETAPVVRGSMLVRRQAEPGTQAFSVNAAMQRASASPSTVFALSARITPKAVAATCGDSIFADGFEDPEITRLETSP